MPKELPETVKEREQMLASQVSELETENTIHSAHVGQDWIARIADHITDHEAMRVLTVRYWQLGDVIANQPQYYIVLGN